MNKKQVYALYVAGGCFVAVFVYEWLRSRGSFSSAFGYSIGVSAGTFPIWLPVLLIVLWFLGRKRKPSQ